MSSETHVIATDKNTFQSCSGRIRVPGPRGYIDRHTNTKQSGAYTLLLILGLDKFEGSMGLPRNSWNTRGCSILWYAIGWFNKSLTTR